MAIDYTMIGKRLKESRMAAKLTQEKVAEAADITTVYLSKIENGKVTPTLDTLGAVCAAVNADLGYVLSGCQYSQKTYGSETVLQLFQLCVGKDICHARQSFRRAHAARLAAEYAFEHRRRDGRLHAARAACVCVKEYGIRKAGSPRTSGLVFFNSK